MVWEGSFHVLGWCRIRLQGLRITKNSFRVTGVAEYIPKPYRYTDMLGRPIVILFVFLTLQPTVFVQGGSNMTGIDLCVNKPHCAEAVRPWESEATTSTLPPARVRTCSVLSGSCYSDEPTEGTAERGTTRCDQIPRWRKRPVRWNSPQTPTTEWGRVSP